MDAPRKSFEPEENLLSLLSTTSASCTVIIVVLRYRMFATKSGASVSFPSSKDSLHEHTKGD